MYNSLGWSANYAQITQLLVLSTLGLWIVTGLIIGKNINTTPNDVSRVSSFSGVLPIDGQIPGSYNFNSNQSYTAQKNDKVVTLFLDSVSGTQLAPSLPVAGPLPENLRPAESVFSIFDALDNGAVILIKLEIGSSGNIFYFPVNESAWSGSGVIFLTQYTLTYLAK